MNKIDKAFDAMLELHDDILQTRLDAEQHYSPDRFAREFRTVRLDVGRQVGKSWYIARTATDNDIIISINKATAIVMNQRKSNFDIKNTVVTGCIKYPLPQLETDEKVNTVWVEEASLLTKEQLDSVYETYAGNANRFVLIG